MRNWLDNEEFQLTAIAVASVSVVAVLTFLATRPPREPEPITADVQASISETALEGSKLRKDAADRAGTPIVGDNITPEIEQEPDQLAAATKGGTFSSRAPDFWPPVFLDEESTSEKTEKLSKAKDGLVHRPTKTWLRVFKALAHHKAAIRNKVPYGSLPNRKGGSLLPGPELQSDPFSEFLLGL